MAVIDIDALLEAVSDEESCGPDLEYDPAYIELENASRGTPEQEVGDTIVAAEPPNWGSVRGLAEDLFGRTKDLRVAGLMARALANTEGMVGLSEGLTVIRELVQNRWDDVHPLLDPDDDYDPTMRVNILESLADSDTMIPEVRRMPLVSAQGIGNFSLRDLELASGSLEPTPEDEEHGLPEMGLIEGAFTECDIDELQTISDAAATAVEQAKGIESIVADFVGATEGPSLAALVTVLEEIQPVLAERLAERGVAVEGFEGAAAMSADGAAQPVTGEITSTADVTRMLDKICDYFHEHEPSSPVPLLLQRAKRLVAKDFMEIIKDLTPDGVSQAQLITGVEDEEEY